MSLGYDERRPCRGDAQVGRTTAQPTPTRDWQAVADSIRGAFVVVVEAPGATCRRRVFLTLSAADRAMQRAHARGCMAHLVLCRLLPVDNVAPGQVAPTHLGRVAS